MSAYMLLCNYTDQGIRDIKDVPKRRAAARELGKSLGVEIKSGHLALAAYDLILHAEAASDEAMAKFVLSVAAKGNVRTTTVKVFSEAVSSVIELGNGLTADPRTSVLSPITLEREEAAEHK